MPSLKRYDIKKLLANPDLRRRLIVESTRVTQAREDIEVATDQAENSYYVVTEAEQAAFFGLVAFRTEVGDADGRHAEFVRALGDRGSAARSNVALRPHDVEFIGRILRKGLHAFHYQNAKSKVDSFWHPLIPTSYPVGMPPNDFPGRVPMPIFYQLVPPTATWTQQDHDEFKAPSGAKKATIASATAILKPGKISQVSLSDNRWIDPATLALPKVRAVADWLEKLIL